MKHRNNFSEIPCNIGAYMLDCDIIVNDFELYSHCYVLFWTNIFGKVIDAPNPLGYWLTVVFWLVNTSSSNKKTNHDMWGNSYIYRKSIYKRETVSYKNIGLVDRIRIYFNNRNGSSGLRLVDVDYQTRLIS